MQSSNSNTQVYIWKLTLLLQCMVKPSFRNLAATKFDTEGRQTSSSVLISQNVLIHQSEIQQLPPLLTLYTKITAIKPNSIKSHTRISITVSKNTKFNKHGLYSKLKKINPIIRKLCKHMLEGSMPKINFIIIPWKVQHFEESIHVT